jgi:hypothetical protein
MLLLQKLLKAAGHDGKCNKMAAILGETKALQAIADGVATKNF